MAGTTSEGYPILPRIEPIAGAVVAVLATTGGVVWTGVKSSAVARAFVGGMFSGGAGYGSCVAPFSSPWQAALRDTSDKKIIITNSFFMVRSPRIFVINILPNYIAIV
jgi:hypothetical protein